MQNQQTMREIDTIVIHCSATKEGEHYTAADIDKWHRNRTPPFTQIGYHYVILLDGTLEVGRDEAVVGAHVQGHNKRSIGICYIGGLDADGKPKDTRTTAQLETMATVVKFLQLKYPKATVKGHRDLSPDTDGDGVVEPHEWLKDCPCFDVTAWMNGITPRNEFKHLTHPHIAEYLAKVFVPAGTPNTEVYLRSTQDMMDDAAIPPIYDRMAVATTLKEMNFKQRATPNAGTIVWEAHKPKVCLTCNGERAWRNKGGSITVCFDCT